MTEAAPLKEYSQQDVSDFLNLIEGRILSDSPAYMHSMLALNELLRQPNAAEIFDDKLKQQAKDLWTKLKSTGLELENPPLIFGLPEGFNQVAEEAVDDSPESQWEERVTKPKKDKKSKDDSEEVFIEDDPDVN